MKTFITPAEGAALVPKVLNNDKEAQKIFYDNYKAIVHSYCQKYYKSISHVSLGLYDYEDIYQHLWLCIVRELPKFDYTRANIVTWLYLICYSQANILYRNQKSRDYKLYSAKNEKGEDVLNYTSLNYEFENKDDSKIEILETLIDPKTAFESIIFDELTIYNYIYVLKDFIKKLKPLERRVYFHGIIGVSQKESGNLLCVSQSYVNRIRHRINYKAVSLWDRLEYLTFDNEEVFKFATILIGQESDEIVATKLNMELAVIKICREILSISDLRTEAI